MSTDKYVNFISSQVKRERTMGFRAYNNVNEQAVSIDYSKAKGDADPEHGGGNRYSSKHKSDHLAALKKAGASDEHAAAIHAHANATDHEDSTKPGYQVMSKHGKYTVHSKHIGGDTTMGGSGHVKYHVVTEQVNEQTLSESPVHADFVGFSKGEKPHPKVLKHHSEAEFINKVHHKDGHEVHSPVYDEGTEYHHIHNGEHKGSFSWSHLDDSVMSHKQIKKKLPHAPDHVVKAIRQDQEDS